LEFKYEKQMATAGDGARHLRPRFIFCSWEPIVNSSTALFALRPSLRQVVHKDQGRSSGQVNNTQHSKFPNTFTPQPSSPGNSRLPCYSPLLQSSGFSTKTVLPPLCIRKYPVHVLKKVLVRLISATATISQQLAGLLSEHKALSLTLEVFSYYCENAAPEEVTQVVPGSDGPRPWE
jgi:hypothetical protein